MPVSNVFTLGPLKVNGSSAFTLIGLKERTDSLGISMVRNMAAGAYQPSFQAIMQQAPLFRITTTDLKTYLDSVSSLVGFYTPQSSTYTTVVAYYAKLSNAAVIDTANHLTITANKTLWVPGDITANQGEEATAACEIHCLYDGSNVPWIVATNASPLASLFIPHKFTLGTVKINGTDVNGVVGVTIGLGFTAVPIYTDGTVNPTVAFITQQMPSITIRTNEPVNLNTFGVSGTAIGTSDTIVFLRKMTNDGSRVANATEEHISLTLGDNQGLIHSEELSGSPGQVATCNLTLLPRAGSNATWVVDTTAAIT